MFNILPQKVLHLYKEEEKKKPNINHEYMVTEKIDGWYTYVDYSPEVGFSNVRNENREIPSMLHVKEFLPRRLPEPKYSYRLIMEAYIPETPFHILNGIFNRKYEQATDVRFAVHDIIPLDTKCTALERYNRIKDYFIQYGEADDLFTILPILGISNIKDDWMKLFDQVVSTGGEGVILRQADGFYQPDKRNFSLMKIKCEEEADLLALDFVQSFGEKGNEAWNLILQDQNGIIVNVRVGKDSDVTKFLNKSPIGQVHQIKYMKKLENGSYREPVYVGPRYDKNPSEID